jgi:hypothetical protein
MEAVSSSEMSVSFYQATQLNISDEPSLVLTVVARF